MSLKAQLHICRSCRGSTLFWMVQRKRIFISNGLWGAGCCTLHRVGFSTRTSHEEKLVIETSQITHSSLSCGRFSLLPLPPQIRGVLSCPPPLSASPLDYWCLQHSLCMQHPFTALAQFQSTSIPAALHLPLTALGGSLLPAAFSSAVGILAMRCSGCTLKK